MYWYSYNSNALSSAGKMQVLVFPGKFSFLLVDWLALCRKVVAECVRVCVWVCGLLFFLSEMLQICSGGGCCRLLVSWAAPAWSAAHGLHSELSWWKGRFPLNSHAPLQSCPETSRPRFGGTLLRINSWGPFGSDGCQHWGLCCTVPLSLSSQFPRVAAVDWMFKPGMGVFSQ